MIYLLKFNSIRTVFYEFLDHFYASYTKQILEEAVLLLGQLWPYLVMGILVSTLVKILVSKDQMARFFSKKRSGVSILLAAFIGALSPVGSYVIIPMSAAVRSLAELMEVQLIDLQKITEEWVNSLGDDASKEMFLWTAPNEKFPEGRKDDTHLSEEGVRHVARLVLGECSTMELAISDRIRLKPE